MCKLCNHEHLKGTRCRVFVGTKTSKSGIAYRGYCGCNSGLTSAQRKRIHKEPEGYDRQWLAWGGTL